MQWFNSNAMEQDSQIPDRVKLDLIFDAQLLQEDLRNMQSIDWIDHFVEQNYDGD